MTEQKVQISTAGATTESGIHFPEKPGRCPGVSPYTDIGDSRAPTEEMATTTAGECTTVV